MATIHPPQASKVGVCEGGLSAPPPVPGKTRESFVSCDRSRGWQGRPEVGKAAVQQAAGCFLGTVTKARDCGEEDPQGGAGVACSCLGTPSVALRFPSITTDPEQGNLPQLPVTRWAFRGIAGLIHLGPLWAARKQELPRITPRRQHAASLILQGKRKNRRGRSMLE